MIKGISPDIRRVFTPTEAMKDIHSYLNLCETSGNSLFCISNELLAYLWSVLKNESPIAPETSIDQWLDLLSALKPHWIIPLLYRQIGLSLLKCSPPGPIIDRMRMSFLESRIRCLHIERQLGEILDAFQHEGVRTLVIRGPALAWSVYSDPAMRPGCDLDLLVLPEQVVHARRTLEALGYRCLGRAFEAAREFFREENFIHRNKPGVNLPVDLHWIHWELHPFIESGCDEQVEDLFDRAWQVKSSTLTFETLHPVDALIHAAIHLTMIHGKEMRLIWIYDIALMARHLRAPDDWQVLLERSILWRGALALENSLKMARIWFDLKLPVGFDNFSKWPRPSEDEIAIWNNAISHNWVTFLIIRYFTRPLDLFRMVRSLFRLLFPPPDFVRFGYPVSSDWLLPLAYLRRWNRWFVELIVKRIRLSSLRSIFID